MNIKRTIVSPDTGERALIQQQEPSLTFIAPPVQSPLQSWGKNHEDVDKRFYCGPGSLAIIELLQEVVLQRLGPRPL